MEPPVRSVRESADVRVAIVQTKPHKGRYVENLNALREIFAQLVESDEPPDLVILPEAALTGYFLEGAVYELALDRNRFVEDLSAAWFEAGADREVDIVCGYYENDGGTYYNSAVFVHLGPDRSLEILGHHRKMFLPTYGVFDEARFLSRGRRLHAFPTRFGTAALLICEDVWHSIMPTIAAVKGARMLIVPSAAPGRGIEGGEELSSIVRWREILCAVAAEHGVYVLYAGLAGFEGGKGMTGSSCVIDPRGRVIVQAPALGAYILCAIIDLREIDLARASLPLLGDLRAVLPDLLLDESLPLPRGSVSDDAADR